MCTDEKDVDKQEEETGVMDMNLKENEEELSFASVRVISLDRISLDRVRFWKTKIARGLRHFVKRWRYVDSSGKASKKLVDRFVRSYRVGLTVWCHGLFFFRQGRRCTRSVRTYRYDFSIKSNHIVRESRKSDQKILRKRHANVKDCPSIRRPRRDNRTDTILQTEKLWYKNDEDTSPSHHVDFTFIKMYERRISRNALSWDSAW